MKDEEKLAVGLKGETEVEHYAGTDWYTVTMDGEEYQVRREYQSNLGYITDVMNPETHDKIEDDETHDRVVRAIKEKEDD